MKTEYKIVMKIAYVYDVIYPYVKGGAEKRIYEISRRLVDRGHEVHVYGFKFWEGRDVIEKEGVYLHGVGNPVKLYVYGRRSIKEAIYFAWKVLPHLLKEKFEMIDCQEFPYFPCFSAKVCTTLKDSTLAITWLEVWGNYWYEYLGFMGLFGKKIEKMVSRLTNLNIAISDNVKRSLELLGLKSVIVVPCGVNFNEIRKIKKSKYISDVVFAGRLIKEKNIETLIKALSLVKEEIPDVRCMIIGDGPERGRLEMLARDLGLEKNIEFVGFLEKHEDVISYMKSSKVLVFPSTREGFGIATLEANACGLPVITVDHPANASKDLVRDKENGFVVENSAKSISSKITYLLNNEKVRKRMSLESIEFAKKFDWDVITKKVEEVYSTMGLEG